MDLKRLLDKIDKLDERLDSIDKTLVKQEVNLEKHMERTEQNEIMIQELFDKLEPISKHVVQVEAVLKFLGLLSIVVGIAVAIKDLLFS